MAARVRTGNTDSTGGDPIGYVTELTGRAVAARAGNDPRILHGDDPVFADDLIETVGLSTVAVTFVDGSRIDLGRNARALLDDEVFNPAFAGATTRILTDIEVIRPTNLSGANPAEATEPSRVPPAEHPVNDGAGEGTVPHRDIPVDLTELSGRPTALTAGLQCAGIFQVPEELLGVAARNDGAPGEPKVSFSGFAPGDGPVEIDVVQSCANAAVESRADGVECAATGGTVSVERGDATVARSLSEQSSQPPTAGARKERS